MLFNLVFVGIFYYSLLARLLRFTSLWQQKEYRIDRMRAFLISPEGRQELLRVITLPMSLSTLRRPRFTLKASLIFGLLLLIVFSVPLRGMSDVALLYVFSPLLLIPATLPLWIATEIATKYYTYKAKDLITKSKPTIIGVSGSYGKTTTKYILAHLLGDKSQVWHTPRSFNSPLSFPRSIVTGYQGQAYMILEYASYKQGEIAALTKHFLPSAVVFTGLNEQHLALFGDHQAMVRAESEIIKSLKPGSVVVYNQDDHLVSHTIATYKDLELVPASNNDLALVDNNSLYLEVELGSKTIKTKLVKTVYATNLAMAIKMAKTMGISSSQLAARLKTFEPSPAFVRVETSRNGRKLIVDDRTSNPTGFMAMIELAKLVPTNVVVLFGGIVDLGDADFEVHQRLGEALRQAQIPVLHCTRTGSKGLEKGALEYYTRLNSAKHLQSYLESHPDATIVLEGHIPSELLKCL